MALLRALARVFEADAGKALQLRIVYLVASTGPGRFVEHAL